jgi:hypothetical protein
MMHIRSVALRDAFPLLPCVMRFLILDVHNVLTLAMILPLS